jgi:hypothetical protein
MSHFAQSVTLHSSLASGHQRALAPRLASRSKTALAGTLASLVLVGSVVPSFAFPRAAASTAAPSIQSQVTEVGYRGYRNFNAPHRSGHHGQAYRGGHGWRYGGAAIGAGAVGLAAGALLSEAAASPPAMEEDVAYCANRFRSYDPSTGTYLGYDGIEHPCP